MKARIHLHLPVRDLPKSRTFYEILFGAPPVKSKPDYAKFLPDWAPLNLALSPEVSSAGEWAGRTHGGIEVDSLGEVRAQLARVQKAGLDVKIEMGTDCCYANQDKFWVRDPDGLSWEIYYVRRDLEDRHSDSDPDRCCVPQVDTDASPGCECG